jgi:putative ABC transport system permease protein
MFGALAMITFRQWRQHKLRLALTLAGIVLGVGVFFAVQAANATLVGSLHATIEKLAGRATLQVTAGEAGFSTDLVKTIRGIPGVALAEPVTETTASTTLPGDVKVLVLGMDTGSDLTLYGEMFAEDGIEIKNPLAFTSRADSVAITTDLATRYGLKEGDKLTIFTQSGKQELTVRGFFKTAGAGAVFDGNVAVLDIFAAQAFFGREKKLDRVDIMTAPDANVEGVKTALNAALPSGVRAERPNLRGQGLENAITSMYLGLTIMSFLAVTICVFIIFNSFSISLNQRWKEIGTLRAIGVESRNIQWMFLGEAAVMGLIGSALGVGTGYFLAIGATRIMTAVSASLYGSLTTPQPVKFDPWFAASAFGVGVIASLIAAWLPARAATTLNPALALHNIETRRIEGRTARARVLAGLVFIAAGILLTRFSSPGVGLNFQLSYSLFFLAGMVLLLPKFIELGAAILRWPAEFLFGAEGLIAVETMARAPRRTTATVGALMIGLSFVFSNGTFIQSQKSALNRSIDKAVGADILVTSSDQLHSRNDHFSDETAKKISTLPGVTRADALRTTAVTYGGEEISVMAHDMEAYFAISPDLLDAGNPETARAAAASGQGIIVSNNFAMRFGLGIGDTMDLETPRGKLTLPIVGMLEYYRSEKGTLFIDRAIYRQYWNDDAVDYVLIDLAAGVEKGAFKNSVYTLIAGQQKAYVYTHEEYKTWATKLIDEFFTLTYLQMLVASMVAALGLVNTMVISVAERKRELGVFRAIGGLRRQVAKMVLIEAAAISIIGLITGLISGAFNAWFLVNTAAKVIAGFTLPLIFPWVIALAALPAVLLLALLSAWLPARHAARLRVIEAIGYE